MRNLSISGRKSDIIAAVSEIEQMPDVDSVIVTYKPKEASLISRNPQNQFEVLDAILAFSISFGAAAAYDLVKITIVEVLKRKGVETKDNEDEQ